MNRQIVVSKVYGAIAISAAIAIVTVPLDHATAQIEGETTQPSPTEPKKTIPEKVAPEEKLIPDASGAAIEEALDSKLERNGGVIQPRPGIDPDIQVPAPNPDPGTTRVIPPPGTPGNSAPGQSNDR